MQPKGTKKIISKIAEEATKATATTAATYTQFQHQKKKKKLSNISVSRARVISCDVTIMVVRFFFLFFFIVVVVVFPNPTIENAFSSFVCKGFFFVLFSVCRVYCAAAAVAAF